LRSFSNTKTSGEVSQISETSREVSQISETFVEVSQISETSVEISHVRNFLRRKQGFCYCRRTFMR
jgi:hypothetical protein